MSEKGLFKEIKAFHNITCTRCPDLLHRCTTHRHRFNINFNIRVVISLEHVVGKQCWEHSTFERVTIKKETGSINFAPLEMRVRLLQCLFLACRAKCE